MTSRFESSTIIYTLSPGALVQRLPYTGTAWSTNLPSYDTTLGFGHTIAAMPDGKVLVGAGCWRCLCSILLIQRRRTFRHPGITALRPWQRTCHL